MMRVAELGALAAQHRALGALRIVRRGGKQRIEVWIYDAMTGKMMFREPETRTEGMQASPDLGHQGVGLLTASLLEIRMQHRSQRPSPVAKVPKVAEELVAEVQAEPLVPRWRRAFAPTVIAAPGRAGVSAELRVDAGLFARPWLTLGVQGNLPLSQLDSASEDGRAELGCLLAQRRPPRGQAAVHSRQRTGGQQHALARGWCQPERELREWAGE